MKTNSLPSIFNFQDPSEFLSAVYEHLKIHDQTLSIRKWSIQIGIQSPQVLMAILKRTKKISLNLVPILIKALNIQTFEAQYFELLVKHSRAKTIDEKNAFEIAMKDMILSAKNPFKISDDYDIFSHWIYSAILDICSIKNVHISKTVIIEALKVKVSSELVSEALEKLIQINLLSFHETHGYKKVEAHVTSKNDVKVKSVHEYYRQTAELAKSACEVDVNEREFQCFSIALNHKDIITYKELIRDFRKKISVLSSPNPDQVYQFNMQFFPLTSAINEISMKSDGHLQ